MRPQITLASDLALPSLLTAPKRFPATGLLVPDLPLEETVSVRAACEKAGIELVLLATPTTPQARMRAIAQASQGFVYLVSVTGVTGMKEQVSGRVEGLVSELKAVTDKPVRAAMRAHPKGSLCAGWARPAD